MVVDLTSCKGSETTYTIELSQKDILVALAGKNCTNENFVYVLAKAESLRQQFPDKTLVDLFYEIWKNEKYSTIKLNSIFDIYDGEDYDSDIPNSIWDRIKDAIKSIVNITPRIIESRLGNVGYKVMIDNINYSEHGYIYRMTIKNVQEPRKIEKLITTKGQLSIVGKGENTLGGECVTQAKYS